MPQVKHGSAASYESGKCRCAECREAGMRARRVQRERRRERVAAGDATHVAHGTWAAYVTDKCRCDECRAFKSAYMKAYRANRARLDRGVTAEMPDLPGRRGGIVAG